MTTYTITNGNDRFGERGPWAVDATNPEQAIDSITAEMAPTFHYWAVESYNAMAIEDLPEDREIWIGEQMDEMAADFAVGLTVESI